MSPPRALLTLLLAVLLAGCDLGFADPSREFADPVPADAAHHAVVVHQPPTLGLLDTDRVDIHGTPIGVACATCHAPDADGDAIAMDLGNPEDVHGAIDLKHGTLTCDACHDEQRDLLHLADGQTLVMQQAMELCSQCHGTQRRDYNAGAHGGMTGHWDLRQGPRTRNHCLDCHDAHAPAFQGGAAVHPPRDRFLSGTEPHHE